MFSRTVTRRRTFRCRRSAACPPHRRALPSREDYPVRFVCVRHAARGERRRPAGDHAGTRRGQPGDPHRSRFRSPLLTRSDRPNAPSAKGRNGVWCKSRRTSFRITFVRMFAVPICSRHSSVLGSRQPAHPCSELTPMGRSAALRAPSAAAVARRGTPGTMRCPERPGCADRAGR